VVPWKLGRRRGGGRERRRLEEKLGGMGICAFIGVFLLSWALAKELELELELEPGWL
jgi:hypothetical protein